MRSQTDSWISVAFGMCSGGRTGVGPRLSGSYAVLPTFALVCWALAWPSMASAQERGHIAGVVGVTFQSQTDGVFGAEVAVNVGPVLQIYGGVNLMQNVLPRSVQGNLDDFSRGLTAATGTVWDFNASARAVTGVGGVRLRLPTGSAWRPYAIAGAGIANVRLKVREIDLGDITNDVAQELGSDPSATRPFLELGGGLEVPVGVLFIDAGYRYGRIVDEDGLNMSRVHFSIGANF
jgi:opacity protein-like surface antigen